jgi:hypothetical protein
MGSGMAQQQFLLLIGLMKNEVRLYERQVSPSDHLSDGQKRIMLENAFHPISEVPHVKKNADR